MTQIDSKIPQGPLAEKWTNYKNHQKLVNPANKRRLDIIVVGTGLAGASAAASLAEMGSCIEFLYSGLSPFVHTLSLHRAVSMRQRIIRMMVTRFIVCSTIQQRW